MGAQHGSSKNPTDPWPCCCTSTGQDGYTEFTMGQIGRRHLHFSQITACVLHGLIPKPSVAFFECIPNSGQAVIRIFNCLSIDKEGITLLFPKWWVTSAQTGQAQKTLKGFIPKIKSGSHVFISKVVNVSSSVQRLWIYSICDNLRRECPDVPWCSDDLALVYSTGQGGSINADGTNRSSSLGKQHPQHGLPTSGGTETILLYPLLSYGKAGDNTLAYYWLSQYGWLRFFLLMVPIYISSNLSDHLPKSATTIRAIIGFE